MALGALLGLGGALIGGLSSMKSSSDARSAANRQAEAASQGYNDRKQYYLGTDDVVTRALREGVDPIYAPGERLLSYEEWLAENPTTLADWGVPADNQPTYEQYLTQNTANARGGALVNPDSDYVTTVDEGVPGIYGEAQRLYAEGPQQYYPGQLVAQQNPLTLQAQSGMVNFLGGKAPQQQARYTQYTPDEIMAGIKDSGATTPQQVIDLAYKHNADPYAIGSVYGLDKAQTDQFLQDNGVSINQPRNANSGVPALESRTSPGYDNLTRMMQEGITGGLNGSVRDVEAPTLQTMNRGDVRDVGNVVANSMSRADIRDIGRYTENNPYMDAMVQNTLDQTAKNFNRNVMPGIGQAGLTSGQYGGNRHGIAQGIALGDVNKNMLAQAGGMYGTAYETERNRDLTGQLSNQTMDYNTSVANLNARNLATELSNRNALANQMMDYNTSKGNMDSGNAYQQMLLNQQGQNQTADLNRINQSLQSASMIPGLQQSYLDRFGLLSGIGQQNQAQRQAEIDADVNRWNFNQQAPQQALSDYANIINSSTLGNPVAPSYVPDNTINSVIGGGLTGLGAYQAYNKTQSPQPTQTYTYNPASYGQAQQVGWQGLGDNQYGAMY